MKVLSWIRNNPWIGVPTCCLGLIVTVGAVLTAAGFRWIPWIWNWEQGTIVSFLAFMVALGSLLLAQHRVARERSDRETALAEERENRLAAEGREARRRDEARSDVVVHVALVEDPNHSSQSWWRLQMSGGDAFSRVKVTTFEWAVIRPGHQLSYLDALRHTPFNEFWLLAGQRQYISFTGMTGTDAVGVRLKWIAHPFDDVVDREYATMREPWS